ncbi:hypothetical protein E2C01_088391 [Portunus trituberculatus]|uniref:Uncharacterized protein n=1 Tax=Portunus trituberculatus TaxID=210409 RepID=A0A5B7JJ89_PORTR|nr:hypothetical protein [Portunus trituberculatus]
MTERDSSFRVRAWEEEEEGGREPEDKFVLLFALKGGHNKERVRREKEVKGREVYRVSSSYEMKTSYSFPYALFTYASLPSGLSSSPQREGGTELFLSTEGEV